LSAVAILSPPNPAPERFAPRIGVTCAISASVQSNQDEPPPPVPKTSMRLSLNSPALTGVGRDLHLQIFQAFHCRFAVPPKEPGVSRVNYYQRANGIFAGGHQVSNHSMFQLLTRPPKVKVTKRVNLSSVIDNLSVSNGIVNAMDIL